MKYGDIQIEKIRPIWVAWTNTDCTEGRGAVIPRAVCEKESTAIRLGRKGSVQGSDCRVTEEIAVKVQGKWLVPGHIHYPSVNDDQEQLKRDAKRAALEKAKAAGLTEADLAALTKY